MTTYRLDISMPLDRGVRRIATSLTTETVALLADRNPTTLATSVHEARKLCKKGRGLARLVRPALGDDYHHVNRHFRDAARTVARVRDPQSLLDIFDTLLAADPTTTADADLGPIRAALCSDVDAAVTDALDNTESTLVAAATLATEATATIENSDIPDDFDPIASGVAKTYERGRDALRAAEDDRTLAAFHEWRKRVKYLWYQTRLLRDTAPPVLAPFADVLHDLSDALGDAHDLGLLETALEDWSDRVTPDAHAALVAAARRIRTDLEDRALALGRLVHVEPTGRFVGRLEGYWSVARSHPPRPVAELDDLVETGDDLDALTLTELYDIARARDIPRRSTMDRVTLVRAVRASGARTGPS